MENPFEDINLRLHENYIKDNYEVDKDKYQEINSIKIYDAIKFGDNEYRVKYDPKQGLIFPCFYGTYVTYLKISNNILFKIIENFNKRIQ